MGIADDIKKMYRESNMVGRFIMVNVAVFLAVNLVGLIEVLTQTSIFNVVKWFAAPSDPIDLAMRPWTVITYMFLHERFWHLFWNMVMLYFSGRIFFDLLGARRFVNTYFVGGLAGLALFILFYNIFPAFEAQRGAPIMGASASVLAILVAVATYTPNYTIFLPIIGAVRLKWIALLFVVLDFISIRTGVNAGGHIAHLGGALWGFLWARQLGRGRDISAWFDTVVGIALALIPRRKMRVVHSKTKPAGNTGPSRGSSSKVRNEDEVIDEILDKISKSGYDSLTEREKEILFRASKK
ncbi:MAG: rhomboid family intramembrane serine protease [Cryomorphaceae bacterium]|nr:MAG: rhomboid family intramembrane serine protease [Cryomorphaceae bacterium]